jgi:hypothetical protein
VTVSPREPGALERPAVTSEWNECNDTLEVLAVVRRLTLVAENALVSGDLFRLRTALSDIREATLGG